MAKNRKLLGAGLGAGLFGMAFLALKYAVRPPTKVPLPDAISPSIFATKVQHTSCGSIVYHEAGNNASGAPLIFLHSICIGASSYEWSKVYPEFASRFRVLAPDWIGFGESERTEAEMGVSEYVQSLAEFIRGTCGDKPVILVASGFGAGMAAYLAAQHPELVSRLILLTPTGRNDFGARRISLMAKWGNRIPLLSRFRYRNYQSRKTVVRAWLESCVFADPKKITDETVDVFTTCAQQRGAEFAVLNFHAGRLNFDLAARIRQLPQPLTLIWSGSTAFPPLKEGKRLQKIKKNCQLLIVENSGALAALETPEKIIEILNDQFNSGLRIFNAG